jgi:hypothetical protein
MLAQAAAVAVTADQAVAAAGQEAAAADQVAAAAGQEAVAAAQEAAEAAVPEPDASGHRFSSTPDPAPSTIGIVLFGPEPSQLIGAPVGADVSHAQAEAIAWYARHGLDMDLVTATCRAVYWAQTGAFASKPDALRWCRSRLTPDD